MTEVVLCGFLVPESGVSWAMLWGGVDTRGFISPESAGLSFCREDRKKQILAWEEIREICHVWLSPDPQLPLRDGCSAHARRVYSELERAEQLAEIVAQHAKSMTNAHSLPLILTSTDLE